MYESFFGLRERPFDLTPNPRFAVITPAHREALTNLNYGIAARKGMTLLVGEAGSGKTTMIRLAIEQQDTRTHCVHLHNPALTRAEFIEMLAVRFDLSDAARTSKTTMLLEMERLLLARRAAGESTVLIADEAQSLPIDLLEELRLLGNMESADEKLLSIIIAGQPEIAARLNQPELRQLKQRIALRCELRLLTMPETAGYIARRISTAGGVGAQLFTSEAVALIHERSGGIPRTINVLADNALLNAFALDNKPVTKAIVAEVCRDFDLDRADAGAPPDAPASTPASAPDASTARSSSTRRAEPVAQHLGSAEQTSPVTKPAPRLIAGLSRQDDDSVPAPAPMFAAVAEPKRRRFSFLRRNG